MKLTLWGLCLLKLIVVNTVRAGVPGIKLKTTNILDVTEYPEISAVIGTAVSLPCNLNPPSPDDAISLVLWYRLDLSNPIYTLDARSATSSDQAKHFSSKVLGQRAFFNVSTGRPIYASMRLDPLEESDAGEYRCRVDFKRGRTLARMVKLNIMVPTNNLVIKDKDNRTLTGVIGPFIEGSSLILVCIAEGGRPPPAVTWWKEKSGMIDESFEVDNESGTVSNEIILDSLQREDLLIAITCQASNTNLTAPMVASVSIDLNLNPLSVQIVTVYRPLSAGERFEVTCKSQGSRPPARIHWWKNEENIDHYASETVQNDITTSVLLFEPASEDHGKSLVCRAENPEVRQSALKDVWTLNIYYVPLLSLKLRTNHPNEQHIREGNDVVLECRIDANPAVKDIRWRFQSKPLNHDPARGILLQNNSLLLQNVMRKDRGGYRCIATNLEGEGVSEELELRVQYPPVCSAKQRTVYGVARHEEANISCEVEADPQEVIFQWSFNNTLGGAAIDILSYSSEGTKSLARYIPRTKLDYGVLICHAKNPVNKMNEPCYFSIVPTGPPDQVQNCTVSNQTSTILIVTCDSGDDGGLTQLFHLEVYSMTAEQLIANITSKEHPTFSVTRLPPNKSFILVVFASNVKGRSTSVAITASTLFSAEPRTGDSHPTTISAVLVVLMGVVGALVFFAIIIILIVKSRGERRGDNEKKKSEDKTPNQVENSFEDKQPDIFHSKDFQTEYVDLTPNTRTERIYESLGDSKEYTYENVIHKTSLPPNQNAHGHPIPTIVAR